MRLCITFIAAGLLVGQTPELLGTLVDIGSYKIHLYCTGQGSPTVVAFGGFSIDWALVQPEVAKLTRVCTYDVAGTAWSEAAPNGTCKQRVDELHKVLRRAAVPGPYVLTGLSVGGQVSRFYAHEFPAEVAGVVLVDHAFTPKPIRKAPASETAPVLIFQTPITFGVEDISDFKKLPARMQALHRWAAAREPQVDHSIASDDCAVQLENTSLGALPLVVVSTGNEAPGYKELQQQLLELSSRSQQLKAERSFHAVEIDQPEVVIEAIKRAVASVRHLR